MTYGPVPTALLIAAEIEYCVCGSRPETVVASGTGPRPPVGRIKVPETIVMKLSTVIYDTMTLVISEFPSKPKTHNNEIEVEETLLMINSFSGIGEPVKQKYSFSTVSEFCKLLYINCGLISKI